MLLMCLPSARKSTSRCCRTSCSPSVWVPSWRSPARAALIRNAAVAGALNQLAHAHERANLVNAASIAEERGIRLTEHKQPRDSGAAAANVVRMTFKSGQQENTVAGCVQPGGLPR